MMLKTDLTGYCGVDCSKCTDYENSRCPGCRKTEWKLGDSCLPEECCHGRGITFCGECSSFPCEEMKGFYAESESHKDAYVIMTAMRKNS